MYAVGGSEAPTINSEGNRYLAPNTQFAKEVKLHSVQILVVTRGPSTAVKSTQWIV
jgi:hypothetical protein